MSQSIFGNAPLSTAYGAVTGGTIDEESAQKLASTGEQSAHTEINSISRPNFPHANPIITGAAAAMKYATEKALIAKK